MRAFGLLPFPEKIGDRLVEGGEFRVTEDGGVDVADRHLELDVAGPIGAFEERGAHTREDLPVASEVINVALRNATPQVAVNILNVLRFAAVNVAREV